MTSFATPLNSVATTVAQPYTAGSGSLTVASASGITISGGQWVRATALRAGSPLSILRVTAVSGNALTVASAIEGTTDVNLLVGDSIELRVTAGFFADIHTAVNALETTTAVLSPAGQVAASVLYLKSDGSAFETSANGIRIIDPSVSTRAPNLIGGYSGNTIDATCIACTIAGGGQQGFENKILNTLGTGNHEYYMVVGGGYDNQQDSAYPSTIAGGAHHRINMATPTGGVYNPANPGYTPNTNCDHSTIGGGSYNALFNCHYATVAGGSNNVIGWDGTTQTTSDGATIGGGVGNIACGLYSTVVGGLTNKVTGAESVAGGVSNVVAGAQATAFGNSNTVNTPFSVAIGSQHALNTGSDFSTVCGYNHTTSGKYSVALGRQHAIVQEQGTCLGKAARANKFGQISHASGVFAVVGDAQVSEMTAWRATTDATQTVLGLSGGGSSVDWLLAQSTGQNYTCISFRIRVVAQKQTATDRAHWLFDGLLTRDTSSATTAIVGGNVANTAPNASTGGASAWRVALSADTTNGALQILVTGAAATNIRWVALIEFTEVGNP